MKKLQRLREKGNKGLHEVKGELQKLTQARESLAKDLELLDIALSDMRIQYSLSFGQAATKIAAEIAAYGRKRRELRSRFSKLTAKIDSQQRRVQTMEARFRELEGLIDERQG